MSDDSAVIFFDGHCKLCSGVVDFVLRHDRRGRFRFATLDSDAAKLRLCDADRSGETVILQDTSGCHDRSTAVLRIVRGLGRPWSLLGLLMVVPRPARDAIYGFLARRRGSWFGVRSACRVPTADERERFLS